MAGRLSKTALLAGLLLLFSCSMHSAASYPPSLRSFFLPVPAKPLITEQTQADRVIAAMQTRYSLGYDTHEGERVTFYTPRPKQALFHNLVGRYRLFGGSTGPGKTTALLAECVARMHATADPRQAIRLNSLLLRRTLPQLEGSFIKEFRSLIPREFYRTYHEQKKVITWTNGATTRFGSMQHEKDVWNYQGHQYTYVGWDELTQFLLSQWETLKPWNRCPVPELQYLTGMDGATNPVGIGAPWVRSMFVYGQPAKQMREPHLYDKQDYAFVPALVWDNPTYANDPEYIKTLKGLPITLRPALFEGRWDAIAGLYFDVWDAATMVEEIPRRYWWPKWVSMDWGFDHEASINWHTTQPGPLHITYREFVGRKLEPAALAHKLIDLSIETDVEPGQGLRPEKLEAFYVSPDAFAARQSQSTIASQMAEILHTPHGKVFPFCGGVHRFPVPTKADDARVHGWMMWYSLMKGGYWKADPSCERLIECIPTLGRDEKHPEDVLKMDGDDPGDSVRYGLYSRLTDRMAPLAERVAAKVTATDPTKRAMQAKRALADESKKGRGVVVPASGRNMIRTHTWRPRS